MYIVTGGAGFIGSNIVKALNEQGISDILLVDDLSGGKNYRNMVDLQIADYMDRDEFRKALVAGKFVGRVTGISHQGACADTMELDGRYMLDNNFTFSKELLHFAMQTKAPLVYASSAATYGAEQTFKEEPDYEKPLNVYGYSKLLFDQYVRRVCTRGDSTVVGLRYFNVYGPRETHKGRMASMPFQLFKQLETTGVCKLFEGTDGYGPGDQRRDFVFVGDVVSVNLFFLQRKQPTVGAFNCGSGSSRSFNDIANHLIAHLGQGKIEYVPFPEALVGKYQSFTEGDIDKLRAAGYEKPTTSLEDGLNACIPQWREALQAP